VTTNAAPVCSGGWPRKRDNCKEGSKASKADHQRLLVVSNAGVNIGAAIIVPMPAGSRWWAFFGAAPWLSGRCGAVSDARELVSKALVSSVNHKYREEIMLKCAAVFALLASPALAQDKAVDPAALRDCPPIGQSAKGELIYGMDCKALKSENRMEVLPNMPPTNMKDTVIPKAGGVQNPDTTPTKGETR
jgi:hypothetical protein